MLKCIAVYCSVLQCVAVISVWADMLLLHITMCGRVMQCNAICCSLLQYVAVCCSDFGLGIYVVALRLQRVAVCCSVLQCVACSVLQCVAVCCSVLQGVAVTSV